MPFVLNASSPSAYAINGYNSTGAASLLASPTSGAFGVTGTFHSNLADLNKLTGQKFLQQQKLPAIKIPHSLNLT